MSRKRFAKQWAGVLCGAMCLSRMVGALAVAEEVPPKLSEPPELARLVAAGGLPPVRERVGEDPLIVRPGSYGVSSIGNYGGIIRLDESDAPNVQGATDITVPLFIDEHQKIIPLGWKSYSHSDDGKVWTFNLRRGMKWSDGHPYTAEDVLFWYFDVALNNELNPSPISWMVSGGRPADVSAPDPYTIQFRFAKPYLNFDYVMAMSSERHVMACPKHYLKRFHPKYASPEALKALIHAHGVQTWTQLWQSQIDVSYQRNTELPTLCPWVVAVGIPESPVIYKRNPYYWMADAAGQQLPYADECWTTVVGSPERLKLRALGGSISYATLPLDAAEVARRAEKRGRVKIALIPSGKDINSNTLTFNFLTPDPFKARLFNDRRFRIAMSLQMPRRVISEIIDNGLTQPKQIGVSDPKHRWYNPRLASAYLEYDLEGANRLLDELGLEQRNSAGLRLGPDHQPITLSVVTVNGSTLQLPAEIFVEYLSKVGLQGNLRVIGWDGLADTLGDAQWELFMWQDLAGQPISWPQGMEAFRPSIWNGAKWQRWLETSGRGGSEPPALMKTCWDAWTAARLASSQKELDSAILNLQNIAATELLAVGVNSFPPFLRVTDRHIQNVPLHEVNFLSSAVYYPPQGK
jgi:peptide/nickel transport system substrate-binding protein